MDNRHNFGMLGATDIMLSEMGPAAWHSDLSTGGTKPQIHPLVSDFYSNLEMMEFLTSHKINLFKKRSDNSKALHRSEREERRRALSKQAEITQKELGRTSPKRKHTIRFNFEIFGHVDEKFIRAQSEVSEAVP